MTPKNFKAIRHALGLTAEGMAKALNVSSGRVVRHWEAGSRKIGGPVGVAVRYMQKFGTPDTALDDNSEDK